RTHGYQLSFEIHQVAPVVVGDRKVGALQGADPCQRHPGGSRPGPRYRASRWAAARTPPGHHGRRTGPGPAWMLTAMTKARSATPPPRLRRPGRRWRASAGCARSGAWAVRGQVPETAGAAAFQTLLPSQHHAGWRESFRLRFGRIHGEG